jgi:Skp family chaperone for outer membrane proteins
MPGGVFLNPEMISFEHRGGIILNTVIKHLKKVERELETKAHQIGKDLDGLRKALLALGHKASKSVKPKKRMSAAARKRIGAAQRKRWAKVRARKKNE